MEFRLASADDSPAILRLQAASFVNNLTPEDRKDGFLSAQFTLQQIDQMTRDVGIIVAEDQNTVVGCLCSFGRDFVHQSPVIDALIRQLDQIQYRGKSLSGYRLFVYGPVVIDRMQRGRGILRGLYARLLEQAAGRFEVGVALVAQDNPHSLGAHLTGLGMTLVGGFEWDGSRYMILAFSVPSG